MAAVPVLAARLQVLRVAGCFWNQPELFGGLRQLTALTELRCASGKHLSLAGYDWAYGVDGGERGGGKSAVAHNSALKTA